MGETSIPSGFFTDLLDFRGIFPIRNTSSIRKLFHRWLGARGIRSRSKLSPTEVDAVGESLFSTDNVRIRTHVCPLFSSGILWTKASLPKNLVNCYRSVHPLRGIQLQLCLEVINTGTTALVGTMGHCFLIARLLIS